MALVKAHRTHGHLAARLDPLGSEPVGDPSLEPLRLEPKLTPELQARIPASVLRVHVPGETLEDVLPRLGETYCGTIAYELEHLSDHQQRVWLRQAIESGRYRQPLSAAEKKALFRRLCEVEGMERFLRKRFLGQKQFSLEGLDVMIPMLDETIELASEAGAHEVVLGMAHRGRLNVLAHTIGMPYEYILREFEGERAIEAVAVDPEGGTGDVKYHLGANGTRTTSNGQVGVRLVANPSHLEAVDPVVEGRTRAAQTDRSTRNGAHDASVALPVLLHGDAAFAGQGIVAETFNLHDLEGYSTGGTLHLITNNQIGFTTDPNEGRSTRYSSDLAKGFDVPIIHVNADDPEASISATRLALAYRRRFGQDVVIDLVGYRRFGHNEQDEAAYTQPLMVEQINAHPSVRELYEEQLVAEGTLTPEEAAASVAEVEGLLREAHDRLKASFGHSAPEEHDGAIPRSTGSEAITAVAADKLVELNDALLVTPDEFTVHPKLARQLERRRGAMSDGGIDWGHAEALAYASLLVDGIPVRITGQDVQRGTFAQRHLVLHDVHTGETYTPMQHLDDASASFEAYNSPLSEYACVGFEYGYSVAAPEALVLWEAQYGDFANGAQIVIDQFISSAMSKWRETSRLTLLLPHGYEGNGPEHSSARLERFLAARRAGEPPGRQLHDCGPVLPPSAPSGAERDRSAPRRRHAQGPAPPEGCDLDARGARNRRVPAGDRRPPSGQGPRAPPHPLQRQGLLRHRRSRGPCCRCRRRRRGRPHRAALPVSDRGDLCARRFLPRTRRSHLGTGRASEHGAVAVDPPPPRGSLRGGGAALRRSSVAGEPVGGVPDGPPDRAGPHRARRPDVVRASKGRSAAGAVALCLQRLLREPRPVVACLLGEPFSLLRRQPAPEVVGGERCTDRAEAACELQARACRHCARSGYLPCPWSCP